MNVDHLADVGNKIDDHLQEEGFILGCPSADMRTYLNGNFSLSLPANQLAGRRPYKASNDLNFSPFLQGCCQSFHASEWASSVVWFCSSTAQKMAVR